MWRMTEQHARWTQATVYPDVWAGPDDDPREGPSLEDELATPEHCLTNYRLTLRSLIRHRMNLLRFRSGRRLRKTSQGGEGT